MDPLGLGLAVGLASAAPLGPQNAYLLHVGLTQPAGRAAAATALVVGLDVSVSLTGVALAGTLLAGAPSLRLPALVLSAVALLVTGVLLLRRSGAAPLAEPAPPAPPAAASALPAPPGGPPPARRGLVAGALLVTWLNPAALLDSSVLFGGLVAATPDRDLPLLVTGLCAASVLWGCAVVVLLRSVRTRLGGRGRRRVERCAGGVVLLAGLGIAGQAVAGL